MGSAGSAGAAISVPVIMNAASPAAAHGPRPRAKGRKAATRPSVTASTKGRSLDRPEDGGGCVAGPVRGRDSEPVDAAHARDRRDREDGCRHLEAPPDRIPDEQTEHRHEADQTGGGEQRPADEQHPRSRLAPHGNEPGGSGDGIDDGDGERVVPERQHRYGQCEGEPQPGVEQRDEGRGEADPRRPARGVERQRGGCPRGVEERGPRGERHA